MSILARLGRLFTMPSSLGAPLQTSSLLSNPLGILREQPSCGFKVKHVLKKRCRDCYLFVRDGRRYILCPTHPRHKQMSTVKKEKHLWVLTSATQGKFRQW